MPRHRIAKSQMVKGPTRVRIVLKDSGWQVSREGSGRIGGVYSTQTEATEAAKSVLRQSGGELTIQGRDGRVRESVMLGRDPMAKISAIEGIYLSSKLKRTLEDLDRSGASGEERRRTIALQFGKKA